MLSKSQHSNRRSSVELSGTHLDKRINQLNAQIIESKAKIDNYLNGMNFKIQQTISSQINEYANYHQQVVEGKNQEIRVLGENIEKYQTIRWSQEDQKIQRTLNQYRQDMIRISNILGLFKKEAEKNRIQLDITQKQLYACKEREKKLLKKVWILEENIRDIYSDNMQENPPKITRSHSRANRTLEQRIHNKNRGLVVKSNQNTTRTILTEDVSRRQRTELRKLNQEPPKTPKPSIYDKTLLSEQLKWATYSRDGFSKSVHGSYEVKNTSGRKARQQQEFNDNAEPTSALYNDLRHSLRQVSKLQNEFPQYLEEKARPIEIQEFRLIAANSLKILGQIEKIGIEKHGQLKDIDAVSIKLLSDVFESQNAVKMLEIILFNYSVQALRQIKKRKNTVIVENYYSQPRLQVTHEEQPVKMQRYHKHKIEMAIRKNFKKSFTDHKPNKQMIKIEGEG